MGEFRRVTTDRLDEIELEDIRSLMDEAFGSRYDDHDFANALGGHHIMSYVDGQVIAHAAVVPRTLHLGDTPVPSGYVESVAVQSQFQGRGLGYGLMVHVASIIKANFDLGALSAGERAQRIYGKLGWEAWAGPTYVDTPTGRERTEEEDGGVMVLGPPDLDRSQPITCNWRPGDVW